MREFKITFWAIILIILTVFIYQNQQFFFQMDQTFRVNLIFAEYKTPGISTALIFLICIVIGFIVSYAVSIPGRMSSRKKIKLLQKAYDAQQKEIDSLNKQLSESAVRESKALPELSEKTHSTYR